MELKATVHEVGQTQQISETFKKRNLILMYAENPTYPEYIKFEALQDNVAKLDELMPGDIITVAYNLRGRPFPDKQGKTDYFNSLVIWKIDINQTVPRNHQQQQFQQPQGQQNFQQQGGHFGQSQQTFGPPPVQQQQQFGQPNQFQQGPPPQQQQNYASPAHPQPVWDPNTNQWMLNGQPTKDQLPF